MGPRKKSEPDPKQRTLTGFIIQPRGQQQASSSHAVPPAPARHAAQPTGVTPHTPAARHAAQPEQLSGVTPHPPGPPAPLPIPHPNHGLLWMMQQDADAVAQGEAPTTRQVCTQVWPLCAPAVCSWRATLRGIPHGPHRACRVTAVDAFVPPPAVPEAPRVVYDGSRLNHQQRAAAEANINQPLLILAGAGTGKTSTLISRIQLMMSQVRQCMHLCCLSQSHRSGSPGRVWIQRCTCTPLHQCWHARTCHCPGRACPPTRSWPSPSPTRQQGSSRSSWRATWGLPRSVSPPAPFTASACACSAHTTRYEACWLRD